MCCSKVTHTPSIHALTGVVLVLVVLCCVAFLCIWWCCVVLCSRAGGVCGLCLCSWVVVCVLRPIAHTFLHGVMGATLVLFMVHETINKTTVASRNVSTFSKKKNISRATQSHACATPSHSKPRVRHSEPLESHACATSSHSKKAKNTTTASHFEPLISHVRFSNSKFAGDRGLALPSSLVTWVWHFQVRG